MYDHYFSNFGSPPVPGFSHKACSVLEKKFLKVFPIQMHREANLTLPKKVKRQRTTILLAILVDLPSPMIPAQVQPQGILDSGGEEF